MSTLGEVEAAIDILERSGTDRSKITILHCTTEYPADMVDVNLNAMLNLKAVFGVRVGYSDHTEGIEVAIASAALGASIIEKHFTLDRSLPGPDHLASLEPKELSAMIKAIRNVEMALGDGIKKPTSVEYKNKRVIRKSLVASNFIKEGELFSEKNITTKRPGVGISPMSWDDVIGRTATRDFFKDELISL